MIWKNKNSLLIKENPSRKDFKYTQNFLKCNFRKQFSVPGKRIQGIPWEEPRYDTSSFHLDGSINTFETQEPPKRLGAAFGLADILSIWQSHFEIQAWNVSKLQYNISYINCDIIKNWLYSN